MRFLILSCFALTLCAGLEPAWCEESPTSVAALRATDLDTRLAAAAQLRARGLRDLGRALDSLSRGSPAPAADATFLAEFLVGEPARPLRLIALSTATGLDAVAARTVCQRVLERDLDPLRVERAAEALGYLGAKEQATPLCVAIERQPRLVAIAAAESLARCGDSSAAKRVAAAALAQDDDDVLLHCVWAVLDLAGSRSAALRAFSAAATDERMKERATLAETLLGDKSLKPHRWATDLRRTCKLLLGDCDPPAVESGNPGNVEWLGAGLAWLERHDPAAHWIVCATIRKIESGSVDKTQIDLRQRVVRYDWDDAGRKSPLFGVSTARIARVFLRAELGEPCEGRRGWERPLADDWELCVLAGAFGADRPGARRDTHVARIVAFKPWELP